jgi:hypothetical protein
MRAVRSEIVIGRYRNSREERNHEVAFPFRLVSHPKNPPSLERIPSDSVRIMAGSLDTGFPEQRGQCAQTALACPVHSRSACKEF